jgi:hypothetical protein
VWPATGGWTDSCGYSIPAALLQAGQGMVQRAKEVVASTAAAASEKATSALHVSATVFFGNCRAAAAAAAVTAATAGVGLDAVSGSATGTSGGSADGCVHQIDRLVLPPPSAAAACRLPRRWWGWSPRSEFGTPSHMG